MLKDKGTVLEKILISRCFLGEKVRYDGKDNLLNNTVFERWLSEGRLVAICPEVSGGLSTPRAPAEIQQGSNRVLTRDGVDVTAEFEQGANKALSLCQQHNIRYALLKESSPSCGSQKIHNGKFEQIKIKGQGVCAQLLSDNGVIVYSEKSIEELIELIESE